MNHGDLLPGNLLVHEGRLTGVLDVGGLTPADPVLDLVSAWHLFEAEPVRSCVSVSILTMTSGGVGRPGLFNRRWARSGTTPIAMLLLVR
ncbi:phosphotransferase [Mycolicibacterium sp. CBMA 226]|uniref:phosphotransferase n=1 Tax=Mycolicibacterium sp. CBMA 226 TaxID=2606611 RepID=UPI001FB7667B